MGPEDLYHITMPQLGYTQLDGWTVAGQQMLLYTTIDNTFTIYQS